MGKELDQVQRHILDVVLVRQDDHRVGADKGTLLGKLAAEIERDVIHGCGQDTARRAARQISFECVARRHAAAMILNQFAHRDTGRRQLDARLPDPPRHRPGPHARMARLAL